MGEKEQVVFSFPDGYYDAGNMVEVPEGAMIAPSVNTTYSKIGKPVSLKDLTVANSNAKGGGSRAFPLDANLVGIMGLNDSTKKATGNMIQSVGRSLWFVGNSIGDSDAVRVMTNLGVPVAIGALSPTPQFAKYNGSGWNAAVQVGLAPETGTPELTLTTSTTRGGTFSGLITGSTSLRLARKRNGAISIASGQSLFITGDGDSAYATIPDYTEDGSAQADRSWLLYFTPIGFGSTASHLLFPIEIPESKLDGTDALGWESVQGKARVKVISQHVSNQSQRIIEVEFLTNDLLNISPFEDYYAAEACKFIAQLGNVMCLIGTGTDATGFDVSYPNNREAFPPDWRDWFQEVPVSLAAEADKGFFWVLGANSTARCRWTGATQQTAPVVIERVTGKYGAIGEGASVCVNGILYFLSKGKTPIRIDSEKNVDDTYGQRVANAFSTFDSTTQLGFDEATNSVVFVCGNKSISWNIDKNVWGSPFTSVATTDEIDSVFSINGNLYLCTYTSSSYRTWLWNSGTGTFNWVMVSPFIFGKFGTALKDVIEGKIVAEADDQPYTITVKAFKDYNTSSALDLFTAAASSTSPRISVRKLVESLGYEVISLRLSGTKGGQTVYLTSLVLDPHSIERA